MKVKELIALLQQQNQDHPVMVYCRMSEDADWATGVRLSEDGENRPYVKGDYPDYGEPLSPVVIIL